MHPTKIQAIITNIIVEYPFECGGIFRHSFIANFL